MKSVIVHAKHGKQVATANTTKNEPVHRIYTYNCIASMRAPTIRRGREQRASKI